MRSGLERRLPGVRFEAEPAPIREALPRLDIAVFVGFAACGPLHLPVPIEDMTQFAAVFGADAPLAWDPRRGERAHSLLGPAVHSFFANGGRRCWVIRVAGPTARANCFPLPGLAIARFAKNGELAGIEPAFARARSEGAWSDALECATGLRLSAIRVGDISQDGQSIEFPGTPESAPRPGDLLRLTFRAPDASWILFVPVDRVFTESQGSPGAGKTLLESNQPLWFEKITPHDLSGVCLAAKVHLFSAYCRDTGRTQGRQEQTAAPPYRSTFLELYGWLQWRKGASRLELLLETSRGLAPFPGSLLCLDVPGDSPSSLSPPEASRWWFTVEDLACGSDQASRGREAVTLFGQALREPLTPPALPLPLERAEILEFDLRVRRGLSESLTLPRLGFVPAHPHYWDELPTDMAFHDPGRSSCRPGQEQESGEIEPHCSGLAPDGRRFPLAGMAASNAVFLPLGMDGNIWHFLGRCRDHEGALRRDGLPRFEASLFLDKDLAQVSTDDLMAQADLLRYLSPNPRMLTGLHAALGGEESSGVEGATLIAVPDAVQRGWESPEDERPGPWWQEVPSAPQTVPPSEKFQACRPDTLATPTFLEGRAPDESGTFLLRWASVSGATVYRLEEAACPDFSGALIVYAGELSETTLYGRSPGGYFYRVRAEGRDILSPWSTPVEVRVGGTSGPILIGPEDYSPDTLLAVHRALLRLCGGRGDLLAVMALPAHYREDEAIGHAQELRRFDRSGDFSTLVGPLDPGEARALSHGALYHPWLVSPSPDGVLRPHPPDGAACGLLAARAITRGAWVAPANEPLRGVVQLAPRITAADWQRLQAAQTNIIRQDPRGFLTLSADTLSRDLDLRPIHVRRLLILLRRLALRRGGTYVFEPLNDTFRRTVQRGFEAMLQLLFERGAFKGATPAAAYQVTAGPENNTPQSLDRGQFFVDLRVAPSMPMTFLTVRLIQAGDRLAAMEVR